MKSLMVFIGLIEFMAVVLIIYLALSIIIDKYNSIKISVTKRIRNINVVFNCEREAVNFVKGYLKLIPAYILNKFDKEGYSMHVLDKAAFEATNPIADAVGYFCTDSKVIVILFDKNSETLAGTICHEFGHFVDQCCYPVTESISPEGYHLTELIASQRMDILNSFVDAKNLYADKINSYYLSSSSEFFAYLSANYFTKAKFVDKRHKELFKKVLATTFERAE